MSKNSKRSKRRNKMMKAIAWCMGILAVLSGLSLDSPSWIPTIVCAVSVTYLAVYVHLADHNKAEQEGDC